ncbi:hypothetical protein [Arachidicoccus rhizosphaerae]|nr:hypothetical protein [Arachidicoccus rhizosphaerae]
MRAGPELQGFAEWNSGVESDIYLLNRRATTTTIPPKTTLTDDQP